MHYVCVFIIGGVGGGGFRLLPEDDDLFLSVCKSALTLVQICVSGGIIAPWGWLVALSTFMSTHWVGTLIVMFILGLAGGGAEKQQQQQPAVPVVLADEVEDAAVVERLVSNQRLQRHRYGTELPAPRQPHHNINQHYNGDSSSLSMSSSDHSMPLGTIASRNRQRHENQPSHSVIHTIPHWHHQLPVDSLPRL